MTGKVGPARRLRSVSGPLDDRAYAIRLHGHVRQDDAALHLRPYGAMIERGNHRTAQADVGRRPGAGRGHRFAE
jgi:hypothetical protein